MFLVDEGEGREDPNIIKSKLSSARQQNAIFNFNGFSLAADDGPTLKAGLLAL